MSCNCKNGESVKSTLENNSENKSSRKISDYLVKTIVFLLFILLLPITVIAITVVAFKMIVLNKTLDVKSIINFFIKKSSNDVQDEYDFGSLSKDDFVLQGVEDITNKKY